MNTKILTRIPHIAENNFLAFIIAECVLHAICDYLLVMTGIIVELHPLSHSNDCVSVLQYKGVQKLLCLVL
jgi:hypothetical protein